MAAMLRWLDPAANPVLVSGPTSWLDDTVATPAGLTSQVTPGPFRDAGATGAFVGVARPARMQWWQLAVTDVCTGAAVATGSGAGAQPVVARWDGTVAGAPAPPGLYRMTLRAGTGSWTPSATLSWTMEVFQAGVTPLTGCPATRVSGTDRYTTSVAIGSRAAPSATTVVLASGADANLVDGLVAAPLAGQLGAPLLLTTPTALPAAVAADISRRGAVRAVVVGAVGAVSDAVLAQLHALGVTDVTRIGGASRYDTAALVAKAVGSSGGAAFVASGATANLVDALSAAGPATHLGRPILLTSPAQLPAATADALAALQVTEHDRARRHRGGVGRRHVRPAGADEARRVEPVRHGGGRGGCLRLRGGDRPGDAFVGHRPGRRRAAGGHAGAARAADRADASGCIVVLAEHGEAGCARCVGWSRSGDPRGTRGGNRCALTRVSARR